MEQVSLFAAATPSEFTIHGSRCIPKRTLARQTRDATQPPYSQPTYMQAIIPSSDGERFTVVTEEDPFLATPPMVMQQSPKPSNDASLSSISPSLTDLTSGDTQHTNLSKPFRRGMFGILKLKGPYLPVPNARKAYTVLMPDDEPASKTPTNPVRRVSSLKTTLAGKRRSRSARRSLDDGSYISDTKDALGLLGSQDEKHDLADSPVGLPKQTLRLKEGMLSSFTRGETMKKPRKVTPFTSEPKRSPKEAIYSEDEPVNMRRGGEIEEGKHFDIYTKAPQGGLQLLIRMHRSYLSAFPR